MLQEDTNRQELARTAYEAYADDSEWKNYQGNSMPQWHELPEDIRQHWRAAIKKVTELLR